MHTNLIILAGGASSRMNKSLELDGSTSDSKVSKALIGMDKSGRPILDYLLFNAKKAGFKNVYLVVGEDSEGFKKCYGNKTKNSFKPKY